MNAATHFKTLFVPHEITRLSERIHCIVYCLSRTIFNLHERGEHATSSFAAKCPHREGIMSIHALSSVALLLKRFWQGALHDGAFLLICKYSLSLPPARSLAFIPWNYVFEMHGELKQKQTNGLHRCFMCDGVFPNQFLCFKSCAIFCHYDLCCSFFSLEFSLALFCL